MIWNVKFRYAGAISDSESNLERNIHQKILANNEKLKSFIFHTEIGLDHHVMLQETC